MKNNILNEKINILNNAIASVEMEGYNISDYERELCMNVLNGNLSKDDFIKTMLKLVKNNKKTIIIFANILKIVRNYGIIKTESPVFLDFSRVRGFFVTNLLLVQYSI